jgi:hypothetical protein
VLAGELGDNKKSTNGVDANKSYTAESDSKAPAIHVKVDETTLSIEQIPPHGHEITNERHILLSTALDAGTKPIEDPNGERIVAWTGFASRFEATKTGGGKGHTHTATATQDAHSFTTTITTPYYVLAFIMKT